MKLRLNVTSCCFSMYSMRHRTMLDSCLSACMRKKTDLHRKTILFRCSKRRRLWILTFFFPFRGRIKLFTVLSRDFWAGIPEVEKQSTVLCCCLPLEWTTRLVDPKFRCRKELLKSSLLVCFQLLCYLLMLKNNPNVTEHLLFSGLHLYHRSSIPPSFFIHTYRVNIS